MDKISRKKKEIMKKLHLNSLLIMIIFSLFLFNKKQHISTISENELCCTKFDNVTVYHGPTSMTNKARLILKKGYPLFVLQRKKSWIKIIDPEHRVGWIRKSVLSSEKRAFVKNKIILTEEEIILMPQASIKLISSNDEYCIAEIKNRNIKIPSKYLWTKPEINVHYA